MFIMISNGSYITKEWLKPCFGTNCKCCIEFIYDHNKGNITSNLIAENDNDEYHNIFHIQALRILCNTSKTNTQFVYVMVLII